MDLARRHILVTGATGFIGSHVVEALAATDAGITAVAGGLGWRPTVPALARRGAVRFTVLDVLSPPAPGALAEVLEGVDGVVHLAYTPAPAGAPLATAAFELERNVLGTLRLLRALPASVRSVVFASSASVYGTAPALPAAEDGCTRPVTAYGRAKLAAEGLMADLATERRLSVHSLRYATVYGEMETVGRAIPNFIRRLLAGEAPVVRGSGEDVRDYVHVSDVARATLLALGRERPGHWICNVGSGHGRTTNEIAARVAALWGCERRPEHVPSSAPLTRVVGDLGRARRLLAYEPAIDIDEGLRREIRWFARRPELWRHAASAGEDAAAETAARKEPA